MAMEEYYIEPECPTWLEAERLIRRMAEVEAERDQAIAALKKQIERVTEEAQRSVNYCTSQLHRFFCQNPELQHTTKTQGSIQMGAGKLVLKKAAMSYKHDDEALLPWAKENGFVRITEKPAWDAIKARIKQTGEIPAGVTYTEDPEEFKVVFSKND